MTLTATDQSPCTGSKSESITLNITPLGNISLNPVNAVVCSSEVIELDITGANYDATSLVASPVSAIVNTATNKIFYSPTNTDIVNGYVDIFVTASPLNPCSSPLTSPTQRINITPEAEVAIANSPLVVFTILVHLSFSHWQQLELRFQISIPLVGKIWEVEVLSLPGIQLIP